MGYKNPQLVSQHYFIASLGHVSCFSPGVINLWRNKNVWCRLKKVVVKNRVRVYFEQQFWACSFSQTHNLKYNKFAHAVRQVESFCISYFPALGKMTRILKLFPWESLPTSHPPPTLAFPSRALRLLVVPPYLSTNYFGTKIHKTVHNWLLL